MADKYKQAAQMVKQFIKSNNYQISVDKNIVSKELVEFQNIFSPSKLAELPDDELLNIIPLGPGKKNTLCYALEYKYKDYFGTISGGSAYKYVLFWSKDKGKWLTGSSNNPQELTEEKAVELCKSFRDAIVNVSKLIENIKPDSEENYIELEKNIMQLLPDKIQQKLWVHKYFSMIYPEYFCNYHSEEWQEKVLNKLGIVPKDYRYVRSGQISMVERLTGLYRGQFSEVLYKMLEEANPMDTNINNFDKNIILYGPPGTGKTYSSARYAVAICDNLPLEDVCDWEYSRVMKRYNELKNADRINFVTFHQSYGYEDLIEGISPVIDAEVNDGNVSYTIKVGAFRQFCQRVPKQNAVATNFETAWYNLISVVQSEDYGGKYTFIRQYSGRPVECTLTPSGSFKTKHGHYIRKEDAKGMFENPNFLEEREISRISKDVLRPLYNAVVDELKNNYGLIYEGAKPTDNCVFIIDEINRGNISKIFGELITLIEPSKRAGEEEAISVKLPYSGESFSVPNNVYILGTMNTADRSIAMMDTALRRRFNFIEMMPQADELAGIEVDGVDIQTLLDTMNQRIEVLYDREHTLGHAFFIGLQNEEKQNIAELKNIFKNKIIPLLQEYFYEDYAKIQLVLGDNAKDDEFKFVQDKRLNERKADKKPIFMGNADIDVLDDDAVLYVINEKAFDNIESYKLIYSNDGDGHE